jgi:hypothetical protein
MNIPDRGALRVRVIEWARTEQPPGFQSKGATSRFIAELVGALQTQRVFERARFKGSQDIRAQAFHPYVAIKKAARADMEEALWLSFLTTACGALPKPGAMGDSPGPLRTSWVTECGVGIRCRQLRGHFASGWRSIDRR